jgi:hypothetical protein|tara:strand:- start:209 stop:343 length:135 start_codon:yes stop_codon:yes gene_type:complete
MKLEPTKKYKVIDDNLVNGFIVVTGKQLEQFIKQAHDDVMRLKK